MDTSTPAGKAFLQMLGVFAEFETALRRERQREGIAKAKAAGVYKGRKPSVPVEEVQRLSAAGVKPWISRSSSRLGAHRSTEHSAWWTDGQAVPCLFHCARFLANPSCASPFLM